MVSRSDRYNLIIKISLKRTRKRQKWVEKYWNLEVIFSYLILFQFNSQWLKKFKNLCGRRDETLMVSFTGTEREREMAIKVSFRIEERAVMYLRDSKWIYEPASVDLKWIIDDAKEGRQTIQYMNHLSNFREKETLKVGSFIMKETHQEFLKNSLPFRVKSYGLRPIFFGLFFIFVPFLKFFYFPVWI